VQRVQSEHHTHTKRSMPWAQGDTGVERGLEHLDLMLGQHLSAQAHHESTAHHEYAQSGVPVPRCFLMNG
jgi:hypothetical protein